MSLTWLSFCWTSLSLVLLCWVLWRHTTYLVIKKVTFNSIVNCNSYRKQLHYNLLITW
jgi:hypothetical protein